MVDIFSIGVILFVMTTRRRPFQQADSKDREYKTIYFSREDQFWKLHHPYLERGEDHFSTEIKDLIIALLQSDPTRRITLSEVYSHPWMKGDMPTLQEMQQEIR